MCGDARGGKGKRRVVLQANRTYFPTTTKTVPTTHPESKPNTTTLPPQARPSLHPTHSTMVAQLAALATEVGGLAAAADARAADAAGLAGQLATAQQAE